MSTELKEFRNRWVVKLHQECRLVQAKIASLVGLSQGRVSQILKAYKQHGTVGLCVKKAPGRTPKLKSEQLSQVPSLLDKGSLFYGFEGDFWSRSRISRVIKETFGVSYSESRIGQLLKKMDYSRQKPKRKDYRQDPEKVADWKHTKLPELQKKARDENRRLLYVDEAGFYLLVKLLRTWAKRGQTPVIQEGCRYTHLAAVSAISEDGQLYYRLQHESFKGATIVEFLKELLRHFNQNLLIIWDGSTIHRAHEVKQFLQHDNQGRIHLVQQPAYSPELNADEQVWAYLKCHELKNVCCKTLAELHQILSAAFERLKLKTETIQRFFRHPDVAYY